ncbi:MAG: phosphotransferase [Pseudomonadota bacterium]
MEIEDVKLIGGYANFMFKLEPFEIVARVTGSAGTVRHGGAWLAREVDLADYLNRAGLNVVRPSSDVPSGPHKHGTQYVTFWEHLDLISESPSPSEVGAHLHKIHKVLESYPKDLPTAGALDEVWAILERSEVMDRLPANDLSIISRRSDRVRQYLSNRRLDCQPLHGDAHYGNLWRTPHGLVWGDFEDTFMGPIEWDLACMTASSFVLGRGEAARTALEAYAGSYDTALLDVLVTARTIQAIAWAIITLPDLTANQRFRSRIQWLAQ